MNKLVAGSVLTGVLALTGCATSQSVTLATVNPTTAMRSASLVPQEGNSADMDINMTQQLQMKGVAVQPPVAAGTRKAEDVDMLVAYSDVWRWDLIMYLKTLNINVFDAKTGNLLVTGRWDNSLFHGFQDAKQVIKDLTDEMFTKLKEASGKPEKVAAQ